MYRIIDDRSSGKTSRLMLIAKESGSVLACSNPSAMKVKAEVYGITGINFISYSDLLTMGYRYDCVLIDELEAFTQYAINNSTKLIGYTISED